MSTRRKEQKVGKKVCYKMLVTTLLYIHCTVYSSLQIFDRKDRTAEEHHQMVVDCLSFYLQETISKDAGSEKSKGHTYGIFPLDLFTNRKLNPWQKLTKHEKSWNLSSRENREGRAVHISFTLIHTHRGGQNGFFNFLWSFKVSRQGIKPGFDLF